MPTGLGRVAASSKPQTHRGTPHHAVRRLGDLIDAAESIEAGDYTVRVRSRGPRDTQDFQD